MISSNPRLVVLPEELDYLGLNITSSERIFTRGPQGSAVLEGLEFGGSGLDPKP